MNRRLGFAPWIWAPLILAVDFVTKRIVLANVDVLLSKVDLIGDLARLTYVRNSGAAMGLFPSSRITLIIVSVIASVLFSVFYLRTPANG